MKSTLRGGRKPVSLKLASKKNGLSLRVAKRGDDELPAGDSTSKSE